MREREKVKEGERVCVRVCSNLVVHCPLIIIYPSMYYIQLSGDAIP